MLERKDREKQRKIGKDRAVKSHRWYKEIKGEGMPGYLKKE